MLPSKRTKTLSKGYFITGTDTDVGKTTIGAAICLCLNRAGNKVFAIKPVATGGVIKKKSLVSPDAIKLAKYSSYPRVIPKPTYVFHEPTSPHIAAKTHGIRVRCSDILKINLPNPTPDYIIVEGVGGLHTPINDAETIADLALVYRYPVILVVGIKLGCINHAILTLEALKKAKLKTAGWVANIIDKNMLYPTETINTIKTKTTASLIGTIPYIHNVSIQSIADRLSAETSLF